MFAILEDYLQCNYYDVTIKLFSETVDYIILNESC